MPRQPEDLDMVHLLRALSVQLNLFGAEFAARNGLHSTDVRALVELLDADRAHHTATPGWLGERLRLNSAATTALIDRLERLGHVRRTRDTADRRRVHLTVEPAAVALGWSFFGPLIDRVLAATAAFSPAEVDTARRYLTAVSEAVADVRSDQRG